MWSFHCKKAQGTKEWKMLVLSRKKNESIIINDNIKIVVVEIRGDKVRLGVEAPKDVPVHRREVYEAIKKAETRLKRMKSRLESLKNEQTLNEDMAYESYHGLPRDFGMTSRTLDDMTGIVPQ